MSEGSEPLRPGPAKRGSDGHPAELDKTVERRRRRREQGQKEGEPPLAKLLAMVGSLGWLIVVPALVGIFLGRFIDRRSGTGITVTAALLMVGLGLGCWLAWKKMHQ